MTTARRRMYRVNEVARIAGVSIRTLHHYHAIGLLVPSGRSGTGYRLYDDEALLRLQQIFIGRELGLSLEEIRRSLDDPSFDRRGALVEQRKQLQARAAQVGRMIRAIDRTLEAMNEREKESDAMTIDMKEVFDGFDPSQYEVETKARWGSTDAYAESARRTQSYSKDDWSKLRDEQATIYADARGAMIAGRKPTDVEAMDIAERHRLFIERWFYPCSHEMHRALADGYESDERFAKNIDAFGEGLTPFLSAAIRANAGRNHV